jgi:transcriptional regulator with XRE-family HTH domain
MPRLRTRELAEEQGIKLSQLQRRADITMNTARRYWYSTRDGKADGEQLEELSWPVMKKIADVLGVKVRDLLSEEDRQALQAAPVLEPSTT